MDGLVKHCDEQLEKLHLLLFELRLSQTLSELEIETE